MSRLFATLLLAGLLAGMLTACFEDDSGPKVDCFAAAPAGATPSPEAAGLLDPLAMVMSSAARRAPLVPARQDTRDIVESIPWLDGERLEYSLVEEEGGDEVGRGTLEATRQGDQFELRLRFESETARDESTVQVDAESMKPRTVRREICTEDGIETATGEYDPDQDVVRIQQTASNGDERSGPRRLEDHYYDNESSLFLWRTINFAEGYEAKYHTVLVNQASQPVITLEVTGREEIDVPAGTFDAWRLEIRSQGVRQFAWFADTATRPMVKYDNSDVLFQLLEAP